MVPKILEDITRLISRNQTFSFVRDFMYDTALWTISIFYFRITKLVLL